jgi:hypothetical protein
MRFLRPDTGRLFQEEGNVARKIRALGDRLMTNRNFAFAVGESLGQKNAPMFGAAVDLEN